MTEQADNAYGTAIRAARGSMSVRAAARAADMSEARWRQLENGYQVVAKDHRVPVRPSERTVRAMAKAVGLDLLEAFEKSGLPVPADVVAGRQVEVDRRPVGYDLNAEADGLTEDDIESVLAVVRAIKRAKGL